MKVLEDFQQATQDLIDEFCKKQEIEFDYFIKDNPAELASFNLEIFFNINDIYYDLQTNQPKGLIIEWYWDRIEKDHNINYYSYTMGKRAEKFNKEKE